MRCIAASLLLFAAATNALAPVASIMGKSKKVRETLDAEEANWRDNTAILLDNAADAAAAAADETRAAAAAVVKEVASAREVSVPLAVEVRVTTRSWADVEVETAAAAAPAPPAAARSALDDFFDD